MPFWQDAAGGGGDDFINMLPDMEYLKAETPSLVPDHNPAFNQSWDAFKSTSQDRPYPAFGSLEQQNLPPTTLGGQAVNPTSLPSLDPSNAVASSRRRRAKSKSQASTRARKLKDWGLQDYCFAEECVYDPDAGQSDCETCSQPPCPSNCGESRRGSVCCDADHCDEPDLCVDDGCEDQEPCVDKACEGAQHPCTDENCLVEEAAPVGTREEAAAAAALTSFGDMGLPSTMPSFDGHHHVHEFQNYTFNANQHMPTHSNMNMDFGDFSGAGRSQFDHFPQTMNNYASSQTNEWPLNLFNHLLEDHSHAHGHDHGHGQDTRPCLADNPNHMLSKCPLPHEDYGQFDSDDIFNQNSDFQCGFSVQDPSMFADHVLTQHKSLLSNITSLPQNMFCSNFTQFMQGYQNLGQAFSAPLSNDNDNANFNFNSFQTPSANPDLKSLDLSTSTSRDTPMSLGTSLLLTPDSAFGHRPSTAASSAPKTASDPEDLKNERQAQGHSLGPQNAYQCFWKDQVTGTFCLQNFENSDDLDAHCRSCHTKVLEKEEGGFRCLWQACKRQNDCFQTKAKLNRHLQTHTGCKCEHDTRWLQVLSLTSIKTNL